MGVINLQCQIHATKVQTNKTFQRALNKLWMEIVMLNQITRILEQQMQSYEMVKEEINLLKLNKERKDARYWALKKQVDDLEIKSIALQWDKDGLQGQVQVQENEIFKFKEEI